MTRGPAANPTGGGYVALKLIQSAPPAQPCRHRQPRFVLRRSPRRASELRLDPDPVVLPSLSVSMMDPADRRLTGTPQPRFGLHLANPNAQVNNITSATIVRYTIVLQLQLLLVNIAMDNVIDQF
jgi:hypothetical protein